jgi:tRNA G18 (ribose-2'-O)-methylase SpoU
VFFVYLILHNLRSAHNVGAIFRTAEAVGLPRLGKAGVSKIYLVGHTPAPVDRFGRANQEIAKTALGAEKQLDWESRAQGAALLRELLACGLQLLALEQSKNSLDYKKVKITGPTAIIVGNEVKGLPKGVLNKCKVVAEIPMRGQKESLNVAVATGIFLYRLLDH